MQAQVFRVPMADPSDASGVIRLIDDGLIAPDGLVAVLGKTEGNGCVNDFTRGYATASLKSALADRLGTTPGEIGARVAFVMSGGTEGGLSPHFIVFARGQGRGHAGTKRLALGTAFTRAFRPEEIGRTAQVEETARAVIAAMRQAAIATSSDVHYVQIKCPLLTRERIAEAEARGQRVATEDTYHSMGLSRGASALGVAVALGEVMADAVGDAVIGHDLALWSARAATSAGIELMRNEIMVAGMSDAWGGDLVIDHGVMQDAIDLAEAQAVLRRLGFRADGQLGPEERSRIAAVLCKAEPARSGQIRGARHIMWDDSDINATRHARALVGGVLAGLIGDTRLFVSGGAEHQGPDGGGPVAVIARNAPD